MNKQIRALAIAVSVCYLALFVQLNRIQLIDAPALTKRPDNTRTQERDYNRPRGTVTSAEGSLLAVSDPTGSERFAFQRRYPTGDLFAHVVGSFSFQYDVDGVEREYGDALAGRIPELQISGFTAPFDKRPNVGNVVLTLREDLQRVAKEQLGDRKGSVVALDPRDGRVLAMWSYPSYDPNKTSSNDQKLALFARQLLDADPAKPRLARAWRDRYAPGSTFKVVTAAAGLESGKVTVDSPSYPVRTSYTPPLTRRPLRNFGGEACGGTLVALLRVSCNTGFAQMGAETLGPQPLIERSAAFGFDSVPPIDLPGAVRSVFPTDFGRQMRPGTDTTAPIYENTPAVAQSAIGQYDVSASPLQMALVAAGIANGGQIMRPHVLGSVTDRSGEVVKTLPNEVWTTATTPEVAAVLRAAMIEVVRKGTATRLAIDGMEVGGKTGTAQLGTDPPKSHAWIIGFAGPPGQPAHVAVAVLVEGQEGASEQTGGRVAAPIARAVMAAALAAGI